MSFIGNTPAESYSTVVKDTFSGNDSDTDFTLSIPATTNSVEVLVENVQQEPTTAYTISGTTLSFTAAPVTGTNNIYVIHRGPAVQTVVPPGDSITTAMIQDGAVTAAKIASLDKIEEGNSSVEVVDTGTGHVAVTVDGSETARFDDQGVLNIGTTGNQANVNGKLNVSAGNFATGSTDYSGDGLSITAGSATSGSGNYGPGISFGRNGTDIYRKAGIAPVQTSADPDFNGLAFFTTNSSSTTAAISEQMRLNSNGDLRFNSGYGSVATAYGCRAWVNFDGNGTVAIRASGNVSSITDNGTGDYTVNFSNAMPDANYAFTTGVQNSDASYFWVVDFDQNYSTSACRFKVSSQNGSTTILGRDTGTLNVAIFR